jgi:co-chaperonin GroES (HSP10)
MSDQQTFIAYLKPYAQAMEAKYGIDWRIIVTQAALESGWGRVNRQWNLWGMRYVGPAGQDPGGYALFNDQWEAIEAYVYNVRKNHPTAWAVRNNAEAFFKEIQNSQAPNAGAWAEDPQYTAKLKSIFSQYFQGEVTSVDPNTPLPPEYAQGEASPYDTASTYYPNTAKKVRRVKDSKGKEVKEKRYTLKLQHINDDTSPTGALTIKISPDSQLTILRERLKVEEEGKKVTVEEAASFELQGGCALIDYHNNGGQGGKQKVTDQIQLTSEHLTILRVKEGEKKKAESLILGDDIIQIEVANDDKKSRIELSPKKILAKNSENSYLRIEEDKIQAKNKTESQVYLEGDLIVAENKTGSRVYLRGDYVEAKCKTGSVVKVTDDQVKAQNTTGSFIQIIGDTILIQNTSGSSITISGGTITISANTIYIRGGSLVDVTASTIKLN